MIVGVVSAKGSPGVTTTAAALAAVAEDGLLVEVDPSGGSIECWTGDADEPGLIALAHRMGRSAGPEMVISCARPGPLGVATVHAPTSGRLAETVVEAADGLIALRLPQMGRTVVADGGRWSPSDRTASRVVGCSAVAVVCRPTVAGVEAARWLVEPLRDASGAPVALVLVGDRPHSAREVEDATGTPVVAALPWDPRAVAALTTGVTPRRGWPRTRLARAAHGALDRLGAVATPWEVVGDA